MSVIQLLTAFFAGILITLIAKWKTADEEAKDIAVEKATQTEHQLRVEELMRRADQLLPEYIQVPTLAVRLLRARLILEEAFETIDALGVQIGVTWFGKNIGTDHSPVITFENIEMQIVKDCDIIGVADGCADVSVVTIGTLSAFGIHDKSLLEAVDKNNLEKFGPGGYKDTHGKWIKPPNHKPPSIRAILEAQDPELMIHTPKG